MSDRRRGIIPILRIDQTLLVSIQAELRDATVRALQEDVLQAIERTAARALVIDLTGLEIVDSYVARMLADTSRMAKLMGTETILAGMRPEVAGVLVRMGYRLQGLRTALNIDEALEMIARPSARP